MSLTSSPRLLKGAIVAAEVTDPLANVVVFQYNPESIQRTVTARAAGEDGDQMEALRLTGPPRETISLEIAVDATDQLERSDPVAATTGLYPTLAALETMLYPKSAVAVANEALALAGVIEILPPPSPLTLLIWGPGRVVPVRFNEVSITEDAFDTALNPIRATVGVQLDVLTYDDLGIASVGGALSMARHIGLEVLARVGSAAGIASAGSSLVNPGA
jgi:hypothetical protein